MPGALRPKDMLISIAIVCVALAHAPGGQEWGDCLRPEDEALLKAVAKWKPAKKYIPPIGEIVSEPGALVGRWDSPDGMGFVRLTIKQRDAKSFNLSYSSSGCVGGWKGNRTARFEDGWLLFDLAIKTYGGWTYDRLYVVKSNGAVVMIPAVFDDLSDKRLQQTLDWILYKKLSR